MFDFLSRLFDPSDFPPRWSCGRWTPGLGWLHILSDLAIWAAYFAIPVVLVSFVTRRRDVPFRRIFWLFGAFILACGTTHLMEAVIFWDPLYRLAGLIKLFTAVVSWATVIALVPIVPRALAMRGPEELEREIAARRKAEEELQQVNVELKAQVEALRASEEKFRLLVDGTRDYAIFMLGPTGLVASWNPGAERIHLFRAEEIVGQPFSRFFPPDAVAAGKPEQELQRAAAEGRYEDENWRLRKDGSRFWASVVLTALRDDAGNLVGFSKITRDMTERKQAEENARKLLEEETARRAAEAHAAAIQEEREWLRVTLSSIGDAVIAADPEGRVTLLNPVAEALTGWTSADAMGRPLADVFRIYNETTREPVESPVVQALREGVVVGLANHTVLASRDGAERPIDDSAAPIRKDGEVVGVVLVFRDATERRRAEERIAQLNRDLQRRVTEFQALLDVIPIGIAVAEDADCRRIWCNPALARLLRLPPEANVSLDVPPGVPPPYRVYRDGRELALAELPIQRAIATGQEVRAVKSDLVLHDDSRVSLLDYAVPLYDEAGRIRGGLYAGVDITEQERTRQALQQAEQRWRTMAEALPNLVWTDLPDGQCDWLSSQWGVYTGIPETELLGTRWLDVLHPDDRPRTLACWQAACEDRGDYDLEYRIRRHDGVYRWFKTRGVPIRNEDGKIVYWFGTCTDIEDQKRHAEELQRSEERFRQLADSMPQIVFTTDPAGRLTYLNRRWYDYTGQPGGDLSADGWLAAVHPDDREACLREAERTNRAGVPFEMELRIRDGRTGQYRWHLSRSIPIHGEDGGVTSWYGTSTDVDESRRAAEAARFLANASATLAGVTDYEATLQKVAGLAIPHFADWAGVYLAGPEGGLRQLAAFHREPEKVRLVEELAERWPVDVDAPSGIGRVFRTGEAEIVAEITDEMLVLGTRDAEQLRLVRTLGLRSFLCVPLVVAGKPLGALSFATAESGRRYTAADLALAEDVARRAAIAIENARLYRELQQADRRKDEFLATLAHELRNPLAPIRNGLQILRLTQDPAAKEQARAMMERQLGQMVRLVDDLLDVSRITRNKLELRKARVSLAAVVDNAVETARPLIDAKGQALTVTLPAAPVFVEADLTRLAQVFWNLLNNSAKYSDPGGRIDLAAEVQDGEVTIRVRDTGVGIPPEAVPNLFTIFSQVEHSLERAQGGLGIGLALVKGLVEMHGGSVEAHSAGVGQGSEFVVRLPVAAAVPVARPEAAAGGIGGPHRRRVLVVDDNRDAAASLAMMLSLSGHDTRTAHDGLEAVELAESFRPDVLLLDIGLPKLNGFDACRRIRGQRWGQEMVIVAVTGWGQTEDRRRSQEAGFDQHLVKPVDVAALDRLLRLLVPS